MMTRERDSGSDGTIKQGMLSLVDQSLCSATNFLTAVIIGRTCSKEEFGLYSLAFAFVIFLSGVQSSLLATPYTILHSGMPSDRQSCYADTVHNLQLLFALVTTMLLAITAGVLISATSIDESARTLLWVLPVASGAMLVRDHIRRMYLGSLRMGAASTLDLSVLVLQLAGMALLLICAGLSATTAYLAISIACILPSAVIIGYRFRPMIKAACRVGNVTGDHWRIGRWRLATHLSISAGTKAYPWLLAAFHGPGSAAIYSACLSLFVVANPFMMGMRNFMVAKFSRVSTSSSGEVKSLVRSLTWLIAAVMGTGLVLICAFGGTVVELIYTERYSGNGNIVCILALATMTWSLAAPHTDGLLALKRPDVELKSYIIAAAVSLTIGALLVFRFGVVGAAMGLLISDGIAAVVRFLAFKQISGKA